VIVGAAVVSGVIGAIWLLRQLDAGPGLTALMLALWQAVTASGAAAVLLVVMAVEAALERPVSAVPASTAPRWVGIIAGAMLGFTAMFAVVIAGDVSADLGVIAGLGTTLVIGGIAHRAPGRPVTTVLLLVGVILAIEVPREFGWINVSWTRTATDTNRNWQGTERCNSVDWTGDSNVAALSRAWRRTGALGGSIGELVGYAEPGTGGDGELVVEVTGTIDGGGPLCYLPLYKRAAFDVGLSVTVHVTDHAGAGSATCTGSGTLRMQVEHATTGIASCRDVRKHLAKHVEEELAAFARGLAEGGR
jgi:hypothetical protein